MSSIGDILYNISLSFGHKPDTITKEVVKTVYVNEWVAPWDKVPIQTSDDRCTRNDVMNKALTQLRIEDEYWELRYNDANKVKVDLTQLEKYLEVDDTDKILYVANDMDCDDFADILKGMIKRWDSRLCIGFAYVFLRPDDPDDVGYHAMLCCMSTDDELISLEPQNDFMKPFGDSISICAIHF